MRAPALLVLLTLAPLALAQEPRVLTANSIGPIRVGMTTAEAEAAWGRDVEREYEGDTPSESCYYLAPDGLAATTILVEGGEVAMINTSNRAYRTPSGIRIGSGLATLRRTYGRQLQRSRVFDGATVYEFTPRSASYRDLRMLFLVESGAVSAIRVGRVPAIYYAGGCAP